MSIAYLIEVLWVIACLGGGVFYGNRDSRFGPMGGGVGGLLAAMAGVVIIQAILGPGYRPL